MNRINNIVPIPCRVPSLFRDWIWCNRNRQRKNSNKLTLVCRLWLLYPRTFSVSAFRPTSQQPTKTRHRNTHVQWTLGCQGRTTYFDTTVTPWTVRSRHWEAGTLGTGSWINDRSLHSFGRTGTPTNSAPGTIKGVDPRLPLNYEVQTDTVPTHRSPCSVTLHLHTLTCFGTCPTTPTPLESKKQKFYV